MKRAWGGGRGAAVLAAVVCLLLLLRAVTSHADAYDERRSEAGARLFRSMLAADLGLPQRTVADGHLHVVFLYANDRKPAEEVLRVFAKADAQGAPEPIHGFPLSLETSADLAPYATHPPGAIFIAQPLDTTRLRSVVQFGIANHLIVFSPFEGHVESGVLGGLVVEAQVRPFVNRRTLAASGVSLKEFFLKVAKVHEGNE
jgi:hypothetical protein